MNLGRYGTDTKKNPFRRFFPHFMNSFFFFWRFYGEILPQLSPAKNPREAPRNDLQDLRDAIERAEEAVSASSSDSPLESDGSGADRDFGTGLPWVMFFVQSLQLPKKTTSGSELQASRNLSF